MNDNAKLNIPTPQKYLSTASDELFELKVIIASGNKIAKMKKLQLIQIKDFLNFASSLRAGDRKTKIAVNISAPKPVCSKPIGPK